MKYINLDESNIDIIVNQYLNYYNTYEDGCWSYNKAYKRIHQMMSIEDSMCLIQLDDSNNITGFNIGYYKEYDDLTCYYLEEIVIFKEYQNMHYGRKFLEEIERRTIKNNSEHIELVSVNDKHHMHFYEGFNMYAASNLKVMGKHYKKEEKKTDI